MGEGTLLPPITVVPAFPALKQLYVGPAARSAPPSTCRGFTILTKLPGYLDKRVPPDMLTLTEPKDVVGFFLQTMTLSPCSLVPLVWVAWDRKPALKHEVVLKEGPFQRNAIMGKGETARRLCGDNGDDERVQDPVQRQSRARFSCGRWVLVLPFYCFGKSNPMCPPLL